ncbi:hypothetical protein [Fortiea contorta]|uniref:hypothetical protein n=1 Tax=Fortiea contorta TaxID=1892405 RepID=UPI000346AADD|nr:hypothetical protein [Fortiea contorta]
MGNWEGGEVGRWGGVGGVGGGECGRCGEVGRWGGGEALSFDVQVSGLKAQTLSPHHPIPPSPHTSASLGTSHPIILSPHHPIPPSPHSPSSKKLKNLPHAWVPHLD